MSKQKIVDVIGLNKVEFIGGRKGSYRVITKVRAGFMSVQDLKKYDNDLIDKLGPATIFQLFKKGALQTIEFKAEDSNIWLTVFALKGKKVVVIDEDILKGITVGTINSLFYNTNLYHHTQYASVGAKTWADYAFVKNEA